MKITTITQIYFRKGLAIENFFQVLIGEKLLRIIDNTSK